MKKIKRIVLIICILILALTVTGCTDNFWEAAVLREYEYVSGYFETEYFKCDFFSGSNYHVRIGGLTDAGKELEEIIIPTELTPTYYSAPVTKLGYPFSTNLWEGSKSLKKIFMHGGITKINRAALLDGYEVKIIFLSIEPGFNRPRDTSLGVGGRYAPAEYLDNYKDKGYSNIKPANVSYLYNYEDDGYGPPPNGGYFWIDDVEEGELILTPPPTDPEKGGQRSFFLGWFYYKKGKFWDFEEDRVTNAEEGVVLRAIWG